MVGRKGATLVCESQSCGFEIIFNNNYKRVETSMLQAFMGSVVSGGLYPGGSTCC